MFVNFFHELRKAKVPVSINEYLMLMEALDARVGVRGVDDFYYLSRACLVKDERNYDKFDRVFGSVFKGLEALSEAFFADIPDDWLRKEAEKYLTEEEMAKVEAMGGLEALMEALRERLAEQDKRHQGGGKMIGTAGTSPFGAYGYNPEGVRIGQDGSRHRRAVKVWDKREYRNLDDSIALGVRNIKVALRRLRRFVRDGVEEELDLDDTVRSTANNGGYLDLKLVPERHNKVKLLLLLDIGGSMDDHTRACAELFSAARAEFKHLEYFYFHNCVYESMWRDNRRRHAERVPTGEVINTYGRDYKVVFVGDAAMGPYEITAPGGSVEHWNEEPGGQWMTRLLEHFSDIIWLNPTPEKYWGSMPSIMIMDRIVGGRMYPLTLLGLERGMKFLNR